MTKKLSLILSPLAISLTTASLLPQQNAQGSDAVASEASAIVEKAARKAALTPSRDVPSDAEISDAVEDELITDPGVPAARIDIETTDGIVELTGSVDNLLAKERAARVAQAIRGVRAVVNRVTVNDSLRPGDEIKQDVDAALVADPATEGFEIETGIDEDRLVTLTGVVESFAERELAERVAKSVRGVRGVTNMLVIRIPKERSDTEIEHDVEAKLRWHRFVDDALVIVDCVDGEVKLTGTVGSAFEKEEARAHAFVAGAKSVDVSGLEVARWARDDDLRGEKYVSKPDSALRDAIEDAMLYDPRVASFQIRTEVDNGVVTLRGTVGNLKARRAAEQDARNCVGVKKVENRIKVRPATAQTDVAVAENLEAALRRDPWTSDYDVAVTVKDGTAYLTGAVASYFEKARVDEVASRVTGVVQIENNLAVDSEAYRYDPFVDVTWSPGDYGWYTYYHPLVTLKSDEQILDDIRDELWWSPFVDLDDVEVSVDGGVATLTGTVDSLSESMSAAENAFEGGAVRVVNRLAIRGEGDEPADGQ